MEMAKGRQGRVGFENVEMKTSHHSTDSLSPRNFEEESDEDVLYIIFFL